jgi:hypothetical protein
VYGSEAPRWFSQRDEAEADVKRRLGLNRLHDNRRKRLSERFVETHEGQVWASTHTHFYAAVAPSHPDYSRVGGVVVRKMVPWTAQFGLPHGAKPKTDPAWEKALKEKIAMRRQDDFSNLSEGTDFSRPDPLSTRKMRHVLGRRRRRK